MPLANSGGTSYVHVGKEFLSDNKGVNGGTGTAGAKLGLSYVFFPHAKGHLVIGMWAYADDDLSRQATAEHYTQSNWFGGGSTAETKRDTLGTARTGALLSLGGVLPL